MGAVSKPSLIVSMAPTYAVVDSDAPAMATLSVNSSASKPLPSR
jgi:hypothetical protein